MSSGESVTGRQTCGTCARPSSERIARDCVGRSPGPTASSAITPAATMIVTTPAMMTSRVNALLLKDGGLLEGPRPATPVGHLDAGRTAQVSRHGSRSEEHTSELQSHSNISYAVFCLKK